MSSENNKILARRLFLDVVRDGRSELLEAIVSPDIFDHSPNFQESSSAAENFARHAGFLRATFSDLDIEVERIVAEDEFAIVFWRLEGRHTGPVWGVDPTGKRVGTNSVSTLRFAEGRLVEYESRPDYLDLLSQLGSLGKFASRFHVPNP